MFVFETGQTDYIKFIELTRKYKEVKDIKITSETHFEELIKNPSEEFIPFLVRRGVSTLFVSVAFKYQFEEGDYLAFLGKI